MEAILSKVLEKMSHYEILNNLIPGSALCFILSYIGFPILDYNVWLCIIICYIVGIVNSRFSSVIIECACRKLHIVEWRNYALYNKAKKIRPFIAIMQESANLYRTFASVFLISLCAYGLMCLSEKWIWLSKNGTWMLLIVLFLLFLCSYQKQINEYVVKNIDEALNESMEDSTDN